MHQLTEQIGDITEQLLEDYQGGRTIDEVRTFDLPDNAVIADMMNW